jgi:hypothetical protein
MKTGYRNTFLLFFLLISNLTFSQQKKDNTNVSTPFLFSQFTEGTILFKDGSSNRGLLNYNTTIDEMQFIGPNEEVLSFAEPQKVSTVTIANRRFMNYQNHFVEILVEGSTSLFVRVHQNRYAEKIGAYGGASGTSSIDSYSSFKGNDGRYTELSPNEAVTYKSEYVFYLLHTDKMKMVLTKSDFIKYFSSSKEQLKQEIERQNIKFDNIDSVKKIVSWVNANGIIN